MYAALPLLFCRNWLASDDGLPANLSLPNVLGQIVGAGLPAKAACQPTHFLQMHSVPVGAGLPAKTACQPTHFLQMYSVPVGAGLPAKTACLPTHFLQMHSVPVGAGLPAKAACQPTHFLQMHSVPVGAGLLAKAASRPDYLAVHTRLVRPPAANARPYAPDPRHPATESPRSSPAHWPAKSLHWATVPVS